MVWSSKQKKNSFRYSKSTLFARSSPFDWKRLSSNSYRLKISREIRTLNTVRQINRTKVSTNENSLLLWFCECYTNFNEITFLLLLKLKREINDLWKIGGQLACDIMWDSLREISLFALHVQPVFIFVITFILAGEVK